jgi:hypothetical protein
MRWAWVDQGGDRPIGGPRPSSASMYVRRSRGRTTRRAHDVRFLIEQETKEDGLIRRALSSLFDPKEKLTVLT